MEMVINHFTISDSKMNLRERERDSYSFLKRPNIDNLKN